MALGCIEMPGTEQNGKQGQHGGNQKSRVKPPWQKHLFRVVEQHIETGRNSLQLQGDIRYDADNRNHRHQTGQQLTFPVARGNEVGN